MLVVVALGGNAPARRGQALDADVQKANVKVVEIVAGTAGTRVSG